MAPWRLAVSERSEAGRIVERQELAAFDELAGLGVVRLHVEQPPAAPEDGAGVDDARGLLVARQEAGGARREALEVVLSDQRERVARDVVAPHLADVVLAADILDQHDVTAAVD